MKITDRYEPDDWKLEGRKITDTAQLERIRGELEARGPVILKHWHYRGAHAPTHVAFDEYDDLVQYLDQNARPGDAFDVWALTDLCSGIGTLAAGKYPDVDGCVPARGAY